MSPDDLSRWLLSQSSSTLTGYLLEAAGRDERLREKLDRHAARAAAQGVDLAPYRRAIDRATRPGGFIDYYAADGFADNVREIIVPLRELLAEDPTHAAGVVELVEHALKQVEAAIECADDSDGEIGGLLTELQELHLAACRVARPDPEELAAHLYAWETSGDWDVFHNAVETYAGILGATGLAAYRRLAETAWKKLPALKPGDQERYDGSRFRVTSIMAALARVSGDVEAIVAIQMKDLSSPYRFLEIAEVYRNANLADQALNWAERGVKAFPGMIDARLHEFLADEYHRVHRSDEALKLIWNVFEQRPFLDGYQRLQHHASRAGTWPAWREKALALLRRTHVKQSDRSRHQSWLAQHGHSNLVEIFLWEKEADAAWAEAQAGGCSGSLWLRLAEIREKDHPTDAIPIYLRVAEAQIQQKNNRAYESAVHLLKKIKHLQLQLGQADEWAGTLTRLRIQHKPKRNFIALLAKM